MSLPHTLFEVYYQQILPYVCPLEVRLCRQEYHWALARDFIHLRPELIRAGATALARVLRLTGGRYNALHPRSTDWAWNNPDKVIPLEDVVANAVRVSVLSSPCCCVRQVSMSVLTVAIVYDRRARAERVRFDGEVGL